MTAITYESCPEFEKDFKRLTKRFRSLPKDLAVLKKAAIELLHVQGIDNQSCLQIPGCVGETSLAFKVKKFACQSLKGKGSRSGLRLTYIFFPAQQRVLFIQMYYKEHNDSKEDRQRIENYLV